MSGPSQLRNDCFALPQGVEWTPVRTALDRLKTAMAPITGVEVVDLSAARGRILSEAVHALSSHPPRVNSAVDGYGFAFDHIGSAPHRLSLVAGRAAAGADFEGEVPPGHAVRILTGAMPPEGVDTVVLQEDVEVAGDLVTFDAGLKRGANLRAAGEDIRAGELIFAAGRRLTVADLAVLASAGVAKVQLRKKLRVAVLSTGDELTGETPKLLDANRPMLLGLLEAWGVEPVDIGRIADDRDLVRDALTRAAEEADAILTTGGASAGDEDHMSAILGDEGVRETWRIAIKPGRPLALGMWFGTPVFGLPGNPVAAFVCALLFARPALCVLAGAPWSEPLGFPLIADFEKNKKPGREEYLRARRRGDAVEVFKSEGSGRVSGLSWADGLVALDHDAGPIKKGMPVRYIPFSEFGL